MFRTFLRDEMNRTNLGAKEIAVRTGVPLEVIKNVLANKPVDESWREEICTWLCVPDTPLFTSEAGPAYDHFQRYIDGNDHLIIMLRTAAQEVGEGSMNEAEFQEIYEYAVSVIRK